jgi:hypothetical protein
MTDVDGFLKMALEPVREARRGQHFSNLLHALRPSIYYTLRARGLDPYYRDDLLPAAIQATVDIWTGR